MVITFYFYTILILLVSAGSAILALSAYFVSHNRSFMYAVAFFLFYFLDVAFIFQFEYFGQNIEFSGDHFYSIDDAFLKILISAAALESMMLFFLDYVDEKRVAFKIIPVALYSISCVLIVILMPESNVRQFLFYTTRQIFMLYCWIFITWTYLRTKNKYLKLRLQKYRRIILASFLFIVAITLEDVFMILLWQPDFNTSILPLYLSQRNFFENFFMLLFAFFNMRACAGMLRLRYQEPPHPKDNPQLQNHIDDYLPTFCTKHNLTMREKEILSLILFDKDTQNIASELHLATGTVKAHVHNILQKTGHETRRDLIKDFWSN